MKILVCPHDLMIGGCQINAIDLAAAVRDLGHEAIVYARPGALESYITETKGLPFVRADDFAGRPAPTRIREIARLVRRESIDVVHAYEWPPCLDAFYGTHLWSGTPLVCTVLSMSLMPLVPRSIPLLLGTHEMAEGARRARGGIVGVAEPPIDVVSDHPAIDGAGFRRELGIGEEELAVVSVSRLSIDLKLDALVDAIDAVDRLASRLPVRLVLVGGGDAEEQLRRRAAAVNARAGRPVVLMPGPLFDPRPAYAAADIVVGMGSSALRGMAHGRPVVVQGERGFSLVFDERSVERFMWTGFYGLGDGGSGAPVLADRLDGLLADPTRRRALAGFGRQVVVDRFTLQAAARNLVDVYEAAQTRRRPAASFGDAVRVGWRAAANEARLHNPVDKRARARLERARLVAASSS